MYTAPMFRKNLTHARSLKPDGIFILSGKYGLLPLDREIDPYDLNLNDVKDEDLRNWAKRTLRQLAQVAVLERDRFIILAEKTYWKYLVPALPDHSILSGRNP